MKEKIVAALRLKFPGLSAEGLAFVADKMAAKITAEDQIQAGITELENGPISIADYVNFLKSETDRRALQAVTTNEAKLREKFEFKEKAAPAPAPAPAPGDPSNSDDVKQQLAAVLQKLQALETKDAKQALQTQFVQKLIEKKIPVSFARGRAIDAPDQIDAMVAEAEKEFTEVRQTIVNTNLGNLPVPIGSDLRPDTIDADIKAWADSGKKAAATV